MTYMQTLQGQFSPVESLELLVRLVVACICGAAIGFERSRRLKEAGLRTHLIVCCASALMMIVSKYGFADLTNGALGTDGADPARIAAQVISGVSFLGAGVIFHNGNTTKGLTTAAGLWATSGIGIAIGSGLYFVGIFATLLLAVIQIVLHKHAGNMDTVSTMELKFTVDNTPEFRSAVNTYLDDLDAEILERKIKFDGDTASYNLTLRTAENISIDELSTFLESKGNVKNISLTSIA